MTTESKDVLAELRETMVNRALWVIVVFAGLAEIVVNAEEVQRGRYGAIAVYVGLYAFLLFVTVNKRLPFLLRALAAPLILYLVALTELWFYSIVSNAVLYLFTTVLLTGVLIGFRAGFIALAGCVVTVVIFAGLYLGGTLPGEPIPDHLLQSRPEMADDLVNWIAIGMPFVFASGSILACLMVMMRVLAVKSKESIELVEQLRIENKQREEATIALAASERAMRDAQQIAHLGSFEWNLISGELTWSPELYAILGFNKTSKPSLLAARELVLESDLSLLDEMIERLQASGGATRTEIRLRRHNDGAPRHMSIRVNAERNASGQVARLVGTVQDITERIEHDKNKRELEMQLRQSQKMEAVGQLAGGIAHDFNNILQSLLGYSRLARESAHDEKLLDECLSEIEKGGERASEVVNRLLTFSRADTPGGSVIDLGHAVRGACKLLRSTLPATIELSVKIEDEPAPIFGDETRVHQVVLNLSTNAADAIGGKPGKIVISVSSELVAREIVGATGIVSPGSYVLLRVSDTGSGIGPAAMDHIFAPFFTTKEVGKGTGLGLSMVHGIAQTMNAVIVVQSEEGVGTTFNFYVPRFEAETYDESYTSDPSDLPKQADGRVLFIDDEEAITRLYTIGLRKRGFKVAAFTDPRDAVAYFKDNPDSFDAVITDLTMPGLTGIDVASCVREVNPSIPVILTSGRVEDAVTISPHVSAIRRKPTDMRELIDLTIQLIAENA